MARAPQKAASGVITSKLCFSSLVRCRLRPESTSPTWGLWNGSAHALASPSPLNWLISVPPIATSSMATRPIPRAPDERIHREPRRPPSPHLTPPAFGSARHKARPHPIRSSVRRSSHQASRSLCGGTEKMPHGINSSEARET